MIRRFFRNNASVGPQNLLWQACETDRKTIFLESKGVSPQIQIRAPLAHFPCDSSDSSSDSSMSTSSSSTSRRKRRRCRHIQLINRIKDRRQIQSLIDKGYSLEYGRFEDDRSLSSLSSCDTDYSTSEGNVGFGGMGNNSQQGTNGGPVVVEIIQHPT
mmetsp:Transcript_38981/g.60062  ORF Transcript_38981/g.60062 Transcript_38981/m.60062 type:complete len:158 (-) Transcript_38981:124-597(-)|eukprot:CAMPEP_0117004792 /NCGR_PEP_ID=MMETSP0472-20121206/5644_1 /TAXON_ID=693140 ORGANISM="Tiarina fusus, Strain LIS" /NCGR_SAMPLE_ID=MMETSP0472 /ASSEMBLY_ACC=CAM_ASM_000603 /LENGTH=157 /DNA_ID=CAMNT_0004705859 /DNA_START=98 /DNA_END=571 /DNA_ORIENTATION=+